MEACNSAYIPTCDENAIACAVYPRDEFSHTNFGGGGFQVRKVLEANTADTCVTPETSGKMSTVYLISAEQPVQTIGGVAYIHGVNG
jgi:hypothetical protein